MSEKGSFVLLTTRDCVLDVSLRIVEKSFVRWVRSRSFKLGRWSTSREECVTALMRNILQSWLCWMRQLQQWRTFELCCALLKRQFPFSASGSTRRRRRMYRLLDSPENHPQ